VSTPHCENCGRQTEYLFPGVVTGKATRYVKTRTGRVKAKGTVDVERDGMVCLPCRPLSNLEIQELVENAGRKTR
jgi:hypothetical protein